MTAGMQPCMAAVAREVRQAIPSGLSYGLTTMGAPLRPRGWRRISPQPFHDAALESLALGVGARQSTVMLGNAGSLVEICLPVLGVPLCDSMSFFWATWATWATGSK